MQQDTLIALVRSADPIGGRCEEADSSELDRILHLVWSSDDEWPRRRARRARIAVIGLVVVAVLSVPPALGVGVTRLLNGEPAPPEVATEVGDGSAYGQVETETPSGRTLTLYSYRRGDRTCEYVRLKVAATDASSHSAIGVCPASERAGPIKFAGASWIKLRAGDDETTASVSGRVSAAVQAVDVFSADGSRAAAAVSNGYFLCLLPPGAGDPVVVVAYGRDGRKLDEWRFSGLLDGQ